MLFSYDIYKWLRFIIERRENNNGAECICSGTFTHINPRILYKTARDILILQNISDSFSISLKTNSTSRFQLPYPGMCTRQDSVLDAQFLYNC